MNKIEYYPQLICVPLKATMDKFFEHGIKLMYNDCDPILTRELDIHSRLLYKNGTVDEVRARIKELGLGRVVLLTKFKDHATTDDRAAVYREKDEIVAQYIGIIDKIEEDQIQCKYIGFGNLQSKVEAEAEFGYTLNEETGEPEPDFDSMEMLNVAIKYQGMGLESIRIGRNWHINLFDGAAAGNSQYDLIRVHTTRDIKYTREAEVIPLPEFIRRCIKSWGIPFNNEALIEDTKRFIVNYNERKKS